MSTTPRRARADTRETMIRTATGLLAERGVAGTSIDRVLAESGAPRGSVYHHFPGGRTELLTEAVGRAERLMLDRIAAVGEAGPAAALDAVVELWRGRLLASDFRAGCPVVAATVDEDPDRPELARSAAAAFEAWTDALAEHFRAHGLDGRRARTLAVQSLCLLEGAVALCRARRDAAPLDAAAEAVRALYRLAEAD